jgi:intracellular sulfur oxidation DsrE/DsrF family protein
MKRLFTIGALLLFSSLQAQNTPHKIIFQLVSGDSLVHKSFFKQLYHIKEGWGDSVSIRVVMHGPAIDIARKSMSKYKSKLEDNLAKGIVFVVCENSMKERKVEKSDIFENMTFVKMGIGEIVTKQEQGWSYIKAGF